jgi:hypothetical protein
VHPIHKEFRYVLDGCPSIAQVTPRIGRGASDTPPATASLSPGQLWIDRLALGTSTPISFPGRTREPGAPMACPFALTRNSS